MNLRKHLETDTWEIPTVGGGKFKTNIPPKKRTLDNIPKYSNGKSKIKFQDWMLIKSQKRPNSDAYSYGKSDADGKWYGWSHRAIAGFGVGQEVKGDSEGKKQTPGKNSDGTPDWDNIKWQEDFTIKNDDHAREVAMTFADNVS